MINNLNKWAAATTNKFKPSRRSGDRLAAALDTASDKLEDAAMMNEAAAAMAAMARSAHRDALADLAEAQAMAEREVFKRHGGR